MKQKPLRIVAVGDNWNVIDSENNVILVYTRKKAATDLCDSRDEQGPIVPLWLILLVITLAGLCWGYL